MSAAHLHLHSHYSFGRGAASPAALCASAARQGIEAVALTDHEGLHGVPEFLAAAARHGLHAVVGASFPDPSLARSMSAGRAVVLARDAAGYAELSRLISRRHDAPQAPLTTLLGAVSEHLWVLSPDLALLKAVARARGRHFLAAELRAGTRWQPLADAAETEGIPAVATSAVQLASPGDRPFQRLLLAVRDRRPVAAVSRSDLASDRGWLLDESALRATFSRHPAALELALEVARDCRLGDPVARAVRGWGEDRATALHDAARRGAEALFGSPLPTARQRRLQAELQVLDRRERPAALLLASELTAAAREQSLVLDTAATVAGSLVAHALGLCPLDPQAQGLPFEPLCDPASGRFELELPVAAQHRDALVELLRRRVGDDRLARPGRIRRWTLREGVRDVARSLSLPASECDRVLRQLPTDWRGEGPEELLARAPRLRGAGLDEAPWDGILRSAVRLAGVPRRLEAGEGVVIAPGPVGDHAPLQRIQGQVVLQWDAAMARSLGLAAWSLPTTEAASTLAALEPAERPGVDATVARVALLLTTAPHLGGRALAAPALRRRLRQQHPDDLESLVAATADCDPQALLEPRLRAFGVESGLDDADLDRLRRALRPGAPPPERVWMRHRAAAALGAAGHSPSHAARRWDELARELPLAPSQAALQGPLVGALRVLDAARAHPAAVLAALLRAGGGAWPLPVYGAEARRQGIALRPPCVQTGPAETTASGGAIQVGLCQIRGLRATLADDVLLARRDVPFTDLEDFLRRVGAGADESAALIAGGALDALADGADRAALHERHRRWRWSRGRSAGADAGHRPRLPGVADRASRLRDELSSLGFALSGHPLELVADRLPPDLLHVNELRRAEGRSVRMAGWVVAGRPGHGLRPPDRRWLLTADEPEGLFDAVLPDAALTRAVGRGEELRGPCLFAGQVRDARGWLHLAVTEVSPLEAAVAFWAA